MPWHSRYVRCSRRRNEAAWMSPRPAMPTAGRTATSVPPPPWNMNLPFHFSGMRSSNPRPNVLPPAPVLGSAVARTRQCADNCRFVCGEPGRPGICSGPSEVETAELTSAPPQSIRAISSQARRAVAGACAFSEAAANRVTRYREADLICPPESTHTKNKAQEPLAPWAWTLSNQKVGGDPPRRRRTSRSASHRPVPRARLRRNRFPGEPGRGYILALRVEDEPVAAHAVQVAEERLLVTREAEDAQRHRNADVDPHHAAVRPAGEFASVVSTLREDDRAVGEAAVVHHLQALFETPDAFHVPGPYTSSPLPGFRSRAFRGSIPAWDRRFALPSAARGWQWRRGCRPGPPRARTGAKNMRPSRSGSGSPRNKLP